GVAQIANEIERQEEQREATMDGGWSASLGERHEVRALAAFASARLPGPTGAAEKVKLATFQSNFCCFPVYVAQHLKLFEKHGLEVELVYGTGIQVANILISGSTEFSPSSTWSPSPARATTSSSSWSFCPVPPSA